ncbi:MAG: hypothetical protein HRU76_15770 [Phycisphaeraceae bacterium]|nr:MAG: hypothetical protein HRU76_15770 [Phycisphaeraceae bacterium]
MSGSHQESKPTVFDAAKTVSDTIKGMEKPDQERVLRWVAESLGIPLSAKTSDAQPALHHSSEAGVRTPESYGATVRAQDIRSFVQAKQPKSDMQFAATVAYYYRFEAPTEQRCNSITPEFLQEATRRAGRDRLTNPRATLNNAVAQGYLDRADRGAFTINTVGENLVAMTLPGTGENGGVSGRGSRKKLGKKAAKKARRSGRG